MKKPGLHIWKPLNSDGSIQWLQYSFGPGTANTLAVRLADETWMVVSPAMDAPDSALDDLAKMGSVSALVAPNAYHHLGQTRWRARFPNAQSFAVETAFPRLSKKSQSVPYQPLSNLAERTGSLVHFFVPRGLKEPDLMMRVNVSQQTLWWMGDLFSNSGPADQVWWLRTLVAPLAGSGPGYRMNGRPGVVYVRDRDAWITSIREELMSDPPTIVIPAHGDVVTENAGPRTLALLNKTK